MSGTASAPVTADGKPVEAADASGNCFTRVLVAPGQNVYRFAATDALGQTAEATLTLPGVAAPEGDAKFSLLSDVSASFKSEYDRTSFDERDRLLYADVAVVNGGQYPADAPLLVAVKNISDPGVQVRRADDLTPDGAPYFDYSALVSGGTLAAGQRTGARTIVFSDPNRSKFTYDLVFLGKLNQAPAVTSVPDVEALAGRPYAYDVDASDPDGDTLRYRLVNAPAGMSIDASTGVIAWTPGAADLGSQAVTVRVEDGRGGSDAQSFTIDLRNDPPAAISRSVFSDLDGNGGRNWGSSL